MCALLKQSIYAQGFLQRTPIDREPPTAASGSSKRRFPRACIDGATTSVTPLAQEDNFAPLSGDASLKICVGVRRRFVAAMSVAASSNELQARPPCYRPLVGDTNGFQAR